jgi:hypothetical protein
MPGRSRGIKSQKETAHNGEAVDLRQNQDQSFSENQKKAHVLARTAEDLGTMLELRPRQGTADGEWKFIPTF